MSSTSTPLAEDLRAAILKSPDKILDDSDVMQALISANDRARGSNVVDLRGIAMDRLTNRLDQLEDTHRSVIAAAYENLSGMQLIHRAVLRLMEPNDFEAFLNDLDGEIAEVLRVDAVRLVLETRQEQTDPVVAELSNVIRIGDTGFINAYLGMDPAALPKTVTLRQIASGAAEIYDGKGAALRSEACLHLDLGPGRLPGMLLLATRDGDQFAPQQGADLLEFFAGVVERTLRHWLS